MNLVRVPTYHPKRTLKMRVDRLKDIRRIRELTQEDIADRTGIGLRTIVRYETGESEPGVRAMSLIARTLEVSIDYLVGLVNEPNGYVQESELSADEKKLIDAFRRGDVRTVLYILATDETFIRDENYAKTQTEANPAQ